jgi:hypothetical protein
MRHAAPWRDAPYPPFARSGNPTAENLLAVIGVLLAKTGVPLQVRAVAHAA